MRNTLIALGTIAAAGVAIAKRKNISSALKKVFNGAGKEAAERTKAIVSDVAVEAKAKTGKLPMFDPKNVKPGRYLDSNGCEVIVDNFGTGIVRLSDSVFQVSRPGMQKVYGLDEFAKTTYAKNSGVNKLLDSSRALSSGPTLLPPGPNAAKGSTVVKPITKGPLTGAKSGGAHIINDAVHMQERDDIFSKKKQASELLGKLRNDPQNKNLRNNIAKLVHPDLLEHSVQQGIISESEKKAMQDIVAEANALVHNIKKAA